MLDSPAPLATPPPLRGAVLREELAGAGAQPGRFIRPLCGLEEIDVAVEDADQPGVIRALGLLAHRDRPLVERLRLRVPALPGVEVRQPVEAPGQIAHLVRMTRGDSLPDREGAQQERLRLRVSPLLEEDPPESGEGAGDDPVLRSVRFFTDRQNAPVEGLYLRVLSLEL